MEKVVVFFVLVFLMGGVFAAMNDSPSSIVGSSSNVKDGTFYTEDFYIFLGVFIFVIFILAIFIWFWMRGPRNKWEK